MSKHRTTTSDDMSRTYGYESIDSTAKQSKVNDVFDSVSSSYDVMNDLMSLGVHRLWKDAIISKANLPRNVPWRALDLASGSGDIGFKLLEGSKGGRVTLCDINPSMLEQARARAKGLVSQLDFVVANAEAASL